MITLATITILSALAFLLWSFCVAASRYDAETDRIVAQAEYDLAMAAHLRSCEHGEG